MEDHQFQFMNLLIHMVFQKIHAKIMKLKMVKEEYAHQCKFANNAHGHHHQLIKLSKTAAGQSQTIKIIKLNNTEWQLDHL